MPHSNLPLSPALSQLLTRLRGQIRRYIWLEGLAIWLIWLGGVYWVGLALDYGPVWLGAGEMPRAARLGLLTLIAVGSGWFLYRYIFRRAFTKLPDRHLALLLERRFPELDDALLTVVDNTDPRQRRNDAAGVDPQAATEGLYQALLERTTKLAEQRTQGLPLPRLFRRRALTARLVTAFLLVLSIGGFAIVDPAAWRLWTGRLLLQTDQPWPRRASLEVLDFAEGRRKVAEGSDLTIRVRADAKLRTPPPEICLIDYRLASGQQGRVNMIREGEPRDGFQYYRYEGQPFQGMLETVQFDVLGLDARVIDQQVDVVASPSIAEVQMDCTFPAYTQLPARRQAWRAGVSLPAGTRVNLTVVATKPLREAKVLDLETQQSFTREIAKARTPTASRKFEFELPPLQETAVVDVELLDQDDVSSQKPYRLAIQVVEDQPPRWDVRMQGIGTAITADARITVEGTLEDDYGVAENWFHTVRERTEEEPSVRKFPLPLPQRDQFAQTLDFREVRQSDAEWQLQPGDKLVLDVRAADACDLKEDRQIGQSDPWPLEVVTADELLAILEARELNQKQRFEQILVEMTETRDSLLRLQASLETIPTTQVSPPSTTPTPNAGNPADSSEQTADTQEAPDETEATTDQEDDENEAGQPSVLRQLRVQRAQQQGVKSQQEVAGVASAFAEIREELVNNRVDTPERRERLQRDIIAPLDLIVSNQFTRWLEQLNQLEKQIDRPDAKEMSVVALQQTNELIFSLQQVLEKMLELETYNELVDLVRSIVDEQNQLLEKTKEERKRQARSLLED